MKIKACLLQTFSIHFKNKIKSIFNNTITILCENRITISNYFFNLTAVRVLDAVTAHKAHLAHLAARALPQPGFNPWFGRRVYWQVPAGRRAAQAIPLTSPVLL